MKKRRINIKALKKDLKIRLANTLGCIMMMSSFFTAYMGQGITVYANEQTNSPGGVESSQIYYADRGKGDPMRFVYGTKFANYNDVFDALVAEITDYEDGIVYQDGKFVSYEENNELYIGRGLTKDDVATLSNMGITINAEPGENVEYIPGKGFLGSVLSAGSYTAKVTYTDLGGKEAVDNIPFEIPHKNTIKPSAYHYVFLQGTKITDNILAKGAKFYDTVTSTSLTFTTNDVVEQGQYRVMDDDGVVEGASKIMNNGKGYSFEYYMKNKAAIDKDNTYTITYEYKSRGMLEPAKFTSEITIIPVFPTFTSSRTSLQVHEGFKFGYDSDGKVVSMSDRFNVADMRTFDMYAVDASSIINGSMSIHSKNGMEYESCSDSMWIDSVKYADGSVVKNPDYVKTADGLYGSDINATANPDGTFTLADGSIYPYRGDVDIVLGAVNSFKNTRLSSYDSNFTHTIIVNNPDDNFGQEVLPDLEDEDFEVIVAPQSIPVINGTDRYMIVGETIDRVSILSKLKATETLESGEVIDLTENIIIESIYKYDAYGNPKGEIYSNIGDDAFDAGKLEEGIAKLSTEEECRYIIKYAVKSSFGKVSFIDINMQVLNAKIAEPYIRLTTLKYAAKVDENLDDEGYNVYYDRDSVWMNNKETYEMLMYFLCKTELSSGTGDRPLGDADCIMVWTFEPDQVKETQSWHMESGVAIAGQPVPEGTVVRGWLFEDDKGYFIRYRDESKQKNRMIKVYVDEDTIDYGMFPSEELNQLFHDTWYDDCCVVDLQLISYQGKTAYSIIRDENGYYLYEDVDTGKRMVFNNVTGDLKITAEELDHYEALGYIWEDTRDYSDVSIWEYGLKVLVKKNIDFIRSCDDAEVRMIERVPDTIKNFNANMPEPPYNGSHLVYKANHNKQ